MSREAVRRERGGDGVHGGAHGALSLVGGHAARQRPPVVLADLGAHALGLLGPEELEGAAQKEDEQVVPPAQEVDDGVEVDGRVALRGAPGAPAGAGHDLQVAAVDESGQVVAGDVGVEGEGRGYVGRARLGMRPDVEEHLAAGGVAEGAGDGRHDRREAAVVAAVCAQR